MADHKRSTANGNPPINRHPLFPAIVALWFGALFGAASIAIRPSVIENIVSTFGIDTVIPMAAPPLGTTTRILIALAMTALGALLGALLARRLARPAPKLRTPRQRAAGGSDRQEADDKAPPIRLSGRRRPLTVDAAKPGVMLDDTGMPARQAAESGRRAQILNVSEFGEDKFGAPDIALGNEPDLQIGIDDIAFDAAAPENASSDAAGFGIEGDIVGSSGFAADAGQTDPEASDAPALLAEPQIFRIPPDPEPTFAAHTLQADNTPAPDRNSFEADTFDHASADQPMRAPSLFESYTRDMATSPEPAEPQPAAPFAPPADETSEPEARIPVPADDGGAAAGRILSADLDELSPLQLLERLALAMMRRRDEMDRQVAAESNFGAPQPAAVHSPEPETAHAATAPDGGSTSAGSTVPAALRPVRFDLYPEGEDDSLPGYVPPRHIGMPVDAMSFGDSTDAPHDADYDESESYGDSENDEWESEDSGAMDGGYSSLLDLSRPLVQRQWQPDFSEPEARESTDGPALASPAPTGGEACDETSFAPAAQSGSPTQRPFDGPRVEDPEDTERALRAALVTLQRMSGAA